jgi:hypothetical protein
MDGRRARRVLGVASNAGPDDIRRAFRAHAQVAHPDHGGTADTFAEVVAAFEALKYAPVRGRVLPALVAARPHVDFYDSAPRPKPRRDFGDVLRAATARLR